MKKFGSYKILKKERLIVEYHSGDIKSQEFMASRKTISSDKDYDPDFDIIFDFRDVNMHVEQQDIEAFIKFLKGFTTIIGQRKSAYLTRNPNEVVVTTLFTEEIKDLPIQPATFSTVRGALDWIDNGQVNEQRLTDIINELKTHPDNLYA